MPLRDSVLATKNAVLAALPPSACRHVLSNAEFESLSPGTVVFSPEKRIAQVLFPIEGITSILVPGEEGRDMEIALVGCEGLVGIPLFFGIEAARLIAIARSPVYSVSIPSSFFKTELETNRAFADTMRNYAYAFLCATSIGAACAVTHGVEQRCSRWLLSAQDRLRADSFRLTHQELANNLGVRRASVTTAVAKLQTTGALAFTHGLVTITDRESLLKAACTCYSRIRDEYGTKLSSVPSQRRSAPKSD